MGEGAVTRANTGGGPDAAPTARPPERPRAPHRHVDPNPPGAGHAGAAAPLARSKLEVPDHRHIRADGAGARLLPARAGDNRHLRRSDAVFCLALAHADEQQVVAWRAGQDRHARGRHGAPLPERRRPRAAPLRRPVEEPEGSQAAARHQGGRHGGQAGLQRCRQRLPAPGSCPHRPGQHAVALLERLSGGEVPAAPQGE
mmetsp:Transcript_16906/g.42871  ORF Transcript_16906/g.42871 Transcript_16906/m.42871 type:complete len:200 (+) Transcript_16906:233-832(+)